MATKATGMAAEGERGRPIDVVAALFLVLPAAVALIFPAYHIRMSPEWLEGARQLGLPFLAAELAIYLYARERGLDLAAYWRAAGRTTRIALIVFLATFWVGSAINAPRPAFSSFLTLSWVLHVVAGIAVHHLAGRLRRADLARFGFAIVAGSIVLMAMTAVHMAAAPADVDWGHAIPGFISVRLYGAFAGAVAALFAGFVWLRDPRGREAFAAYALLTILMAAVAWSGTRAGVMGFAVAMAAGCVMRRGLPPMRMLVMLPLCAALAQLIALIAVPDDPRFYLFTLADAADADAATGGRLTVWAEALRLIAAYPLFGAGSGSTFWLGLRHVQPHNAPLQFVAAWGPVAAAAAFVLLGKAVWAAHKAARATPWLLPAILMLDCLLAMSLVDGTLYFPRFIMLIFAAIALCLAGGRGARG